MAPLELVSIEQQQKQREAEAATRGRFVVKGRWARTSSGDLVPEEEAFQGGELAYRDRQEITIAEAERAGFLKGAGEDEVVELFVVEGNWARTAEGALVEEAAAPSGSELAYRAGQEITRAEALEVGLAKPEPSGRPSRSRAPSGRPSRSRASSGRPSRRPRAERKAQPKPADKAKRKPADKSVRKPATKEG